MFVFSPKLPTSRSARFGAALPLPFARATAALVWGCFFVFNVMNIRSTIQPVIRTALATGRVKCFTIGLGGAIAFGRYLTDFAFFLSRPADVIARRARKHTALRGTEHLLRAVEQGKGAVVVYSNFSCFYYGLTTPRAGLIPDDVEVVIVQPFYSVNGPDAIAFKEKLGTVMGRELKIIESGSTRAGLEMTSALKRGAVVVCMIDFFPPNVSSFAITQFLNQPSCQPTGLSAIAARNGAPIVPCFTFFENGTYTTEFFEAIDAQQSAHDSDDVFALCSRIDEVMTDTVMRRPSEWASWISVPNKWNTAASLLAEVGDQA